MKSLIKGISPKLHLETIITYFPIDEIIVKVSPFQNTRRLVRENTL